MRDVITQLYKNTANLILHSLRLAVGVLFANLLLEKQHAPNSPLEVFVEIVPCNQEESAVPMQLKYLSRIF